LINLLSKNCILCTSGDFSRYAVERYVIPPSAILDTWNAFSGTFMIPSRSCEIYTITPITAVEINVFVKLLKSFLKSNSWRCLLRSVINRMLYNTNPTVNPIENHSIPKTGATNIVMSATTVREKIFISIGVIVFFIA